MYVPSQAFSKRDLPGHTVLKERRPGQGTAADVASRDLAAELRAREAAAAAASEGAVMTAMTTAMVERKPTLALPPLDADEEIAEESEDDEEATTTTTTAAAAAEEEDESEDEDDTAELLAELERIKKERAEEAKRRAAAEKASAERERDAAAATANPLLAEAAEDVGAGGFAVKKKWYEDTVFRNQSRGEPTAQHRFVNDTVRNDFHLRFLRKYMK